VKNQFICGDCLEIIRQIPPRSVDLVFGSPPYEDCRTYGIDFNLKGQEWVDWMVEVYKTSLQICKGLVAFVVQGRTRNYQWSATPALLIADLHRAGICVRNPPLYQRSGIPGSGGPDWLRGDYEWVVCATNGGRLPWSDNTAMGHPPKWQKPGGPCSNWQKTTTVMGHGDTRTVSKNYEPSKKSNPGNIIKRHADELPEQGMRYPNGKRRKHGYTLDQIEIANPGNMINCGAVGGGHLGSKLAHENEAPFAEYLAEFFIRSFCPPGGWLLDPFSGSGTTCAVAEKTGRMWTGIDIRQNQIDLGCKRILEVRNEYNN
jgi:hypothetical protein